MLLGELAESFLAASGNSFSANTLRAYRYDLNSLAKAFPEMEVSEAGVEHLRAFLGATAELAPSTLARKQATLRSCFGWAYREGLIGSDPAARLEKVKVPRRDPRPLTEEQAETLLAAIPAADRRNRLLFTLLYETGMRVGEALGVHVGHVHPNATDGGYIRVVGKGDEERIVPLIDAPRTVRLSTRMSSTPGLPADEARSAQPEAAPGPAPPTTPDSDHRLLPQPRQLLRSCATGTATSRYFPSKQGHPCVTPRSHHQLRWRIQA